MNYTGKTFKVISENAKREENGDIRYTGDAARKLLVGVNRVGDIVGSTLGPDGKRVIYDRDHSFPIVTKDGASVANQVVLDDEIENLGAQTTIDAALKTEKHVGDATTTTTVLVQAGANKIFNMLGVDPDVVGSKKVKVRELVNKLRESKDVIVSKIKERATKIETKEDMLNIVSCSLERPDLNEKVAQMAWDVGAEGFFSVEEGFKEETEFDTVLGMYLRGKIHDKRFLMQATKTDLEDVYIVVTDYPLKDVREFVSFAGGLVSYLNRDREKGQPPIIPTVAFFAPDFSSEIIGAFAKNIEKKTFYALPINSKSIDDDTKADIAVYANTEFLRESEGKRLNSVNFDKLSTVDKIIVTEKECILMGGDGDVDKRVKDLTAELEKMNVEFAINKQKRRISALTSGIGIVKVGSRTDIGRRDLKHKMDDVRGAIGAAWEGGYVRGGGLTLKAISEELSEDNILKDVILEPHKRIMENSEGELEIGDNVIDPAKCQIVALENATETIINLITIGTAIARRDDKDQDEKRMIE